MRIYIIEDDIVLRKELAKFSKVTVQAVISSIPLSLGVSSGNIVFIVGIINNYRTNWSYGY